MQVLSLAIHFSGPWAVKSPHVGQLCLELWAFWDLGLLGLETMLTVSDTKLSFAVEETPIMEVATWLITCSRLISLTRTASDNFIALIVA